MRLTGNDGLSKFNNDLRMDCVKQILVICVLMLLPVAAHTDGESETLKFDNGTYEGMVKGSLFQQMVGSTTVSGKRGS